eukprot:960480-Amphidinium_carterae.1
MAIEVRPKVGHKARDSDLFSVDGCVCVFGSRRLARAARRVQVTTGVGPPACSSSPAFQHLSALLQTPLLQQFYRRTCCQQSPFGQSR